MSNDTSLVEELSFQKIDANLNSDSLLKELRYKLNQFLNNSPNYVISNEQASLLIDNLCDIILTHISSKDIAILCFLFIQKILVLFSNSVQHFLANFLLLSKQFGFEINQVILTDPSLSLLQLSCKKNTNIFIKLIFLREFVTGKDKIIINFLFSDSFNNSIIYQFFLKQLLVLYQDELISFYITIFSHSLIQWLDSAMLFFKQISYNSENDQNVFQIKSELHTFIQDFVWKYIEEALPGIPENSKLILQKYFRLYQRYLTWSRKDSSFFLKYLKNTLAIPWASKARYILLNILCEFVSPSVILNTHTNLNNELTNCMSTTNLYTAASELYRTLIKDISVENWIQTWLHPFMRSLLSNDHNERHHLTQYWLPATIKSIHRSSQVIIDVLYTISIQVNSPIEKLLNAISLSDNSDYISQALSPTYTNILYAAIQYLNYSINLDIIKLTDDCIGILRDGLSSGDEYIRIEALYIVLTVPFDSSQLWRLDLIREFVPFNLNPSSSPFRQKLSLLINKSITCIQAVLIDNMPREKSVESIEYFQQKYVDFIRTLSFYRFSSLQCLLPDSTFQKVSLGLSIYQSLVDSFIRPVETKKSNSKSKRAKLNIYTMIAPVEFELLTLPDLTLISLCLTSDYFEIRELATAIITPYLVNTNTIAAIHSVFPTGLYTTGKQLITSSRVYDGEIGALLLRIHLDNSIQNNVCVNPMELQYRLCVDLLAVLSTQFMAAKKNILEAANNAPLFSAITAINSVLNHKLNGDVMGIDWQQYLRELISLLDDVITFSLTTLTGSNNEDMLAPSFADMGVAIETAVLSVHNSTDSTTHHTDCSSLSYQLVMNCVWLALREASSLLGSLSDVFGITTPVDRNMLVVTPELVEKIGSILIAILTKCRHVGAILTCQSALTKFCYSISNSNIPAVCCLTFQWLDGIINTITSQDVKSSISRQGAGLPFCVQSLLCSESKLPHKPLLQFAMEKLLTHAGATESVLVADTHDLASVRCMNVLRILYRDSTVGNRCVLSYGERGLFLAVTSMRSSLWSVRNAGMMLFGALAVRMLGQRRLSEDTIELSTITLQQLFTRFPLIRSLFLLQLSSSSDCISTILHSAVYPVILFLCKLCPSPHYNFSEKSSYIRALQVYTHSVVYSVRCKASQALSMFVYKPSVDTVLLHVLEKIPDSIEQCISYNYIHGQLEFLAELIRLNYVLYNTGSSSALVKVHQCVNRCKWLFSNDTPLIIRKVYFSIICMLDSDELSSSLLHVLSEHTSLDVHSINLYLSVIHFYLSCSNTATQSLLIKFSEKLFNILSNDRDHSRLCTELLEHTQILPWLFENSNNTYVSLFNRCVLMPDSLSHTDMCSRLEILVQMLHQVITLNSTCFDVDFNLLTNCILRYNTIYTSLMLELCCLQISSLILIRKINNPLLVIERENELFALLTRLLNTHSKPDSSEDSRIIAGNYLVKIFSSLILYPSLIQPISTIQFVIIKNIILLLQDEVAEIRTSLADGISEVLDSHLPLDNHITLKFIFTWLANTLFTLEGCWELMVDYISSEICINVNSVKDEVVLFEKGKDNIYGEDCVNCEFAFKSLLIVSINLKQTELFGNFVQYLFEFIKTKSNVLSNIATTNSLDGMLSSNSLLYRQITGILCVIKLMESLCENIPDDLNTILNLTEQSCLISLYLKRIENWI